MIYDGIVYLELLANYVDICLAALILFTELHPCNFCEEAIVMFYIMVMFHFKIIGTRKIM